VIIAMKNSSQFKALRPYQLYCDGMCFLGAGALAAHHPLRMKETVNR